MLSGAKNISWLGLSLGIVLMGLGVGTKAQLKVIILDDQTGEPLPYAHVLQLDENGKRISASVASMLGEAVLPVHGDQAYPRWIEAQSLGYESKKLQIETPQNAVVRLARSEVFLQEVVITAQYSPGSAAQAVHKIKVIDQEKIQRMAAVNLEDVLTNEVNMRIGQDAVLGSSISMQGVSGQNVKIMIDGVPVIGRQNGNIDLKQINLNDIEQIEIVEGPLSVNYGTDALAGTINIITKKSSINKTEVKISSYNETIGRYNNTASLNRQFGKLRLALNGGRNFFNGWDIGDRIEPNTLQPVADTTRTHSWDPRMQYFGRAQLSHFGKQHTISWRSEYFDERITNRGMPRKPYLEQAFDDFYITRRIDHALNGQVELSPKLRLNGVAAYNQFERISNTYIVDLTTLERVLTGTPGDQDTAVAHQWMSRSSLIYVASPKWLTLEFGYDVNSELAVGRRIKEGAQRMGDYAAFSTAELKLGKFLTLRPGIRYAYNTAYLAPITPSFNAKWAWEKWTFRGSYARGFRAPGLKELYFNFVDINHNIVGNANLVAEHSNNFNFSLGYRKFIRQFMIQWESSAFYNDIRNLITLGMVDVATQEFSYVNVGRAQTNGVNAALGIVLEHLKVNLGAAFIGIQNQFAAEHPDSKFYYYPEATGNLTYAWHQKGIDVSFFYKYQGSLPQVRINANEELETGYIQGFHTLDGNVTKAFWSDRISLGIGAKNLFNVQNVGIVGGGAGDGVHSAASNAAMVGMGRLYFLKLDFQWMQ
jgi:outer membrane receptor for ferrienterochelin and colicins